MLRAGFVGDFVFLGARRWAQNHPLTLGVLWGIWGFSCSSIFLTPLTLEGPSLAGLFPVLLCLDS